MAGTIPWRLGNVPHRLRKVRKQRGSRTHGWGQVTQHRCGGMSGGRGKTVGLHKHRWTYAVKYEPDYFGKHGFRSVWEHEAETVNVGELDERVEALLGAGLAKKGKKGIAIDLAKLGVEKLLGSGRVTHPLIVRAEAWSGTAAEKVKEAGGQILAPTDKEGKE